MISREASTRKGSEMQQAESRLESSKPLALLRDSNNPGSFSSFRRLFVLVSTAV